MDNLEAKGLTWANYVVDSSWEMMMKKFRDNPDKVIKMEAKEANERSFFKDVAAGTLPAYSWLNPRSGSPSDDQHPDHDVSLGEARMKKIYEALRASPKWEETLFIITYDEHGGFYDHVNPPMGVPKVDDPQCPDSRFVPDRLGIRIPTVVIGPMVPKGMIVNEPSQESKPFPNSEYELSSILSAIKKIFDLPNFLTKRDAWAATFDNLFLDENRSEDDCIKKLPDVPKTFTAEDLIREQNFPLNENQQQIIEQYMDINQVEDPKITRQGDLGPWLEEQLQLWKKRGGPHPNASR